MRMRRHAWTHTWSQCHKMYFYSCLFFIVSTRPWPSLQGLLLIFRQPTRSPSDSTGDAGLWTKFCLQAFCDFMNLPLRMAVVIGTKIYSFFGGSPLAVSSFASCSFMYASRLYDYIWLYGPRDHIWQKLLRYVSMKFAESGSPLSTHLYFTAW